MSEKIYWKDPYIKEFDARIERLRENELILDRTAFYPGGGGQPFDTGRIIAEGKEYHITEARKSGDDVIHIASSNINSEEGAVVKGYIDWRKRYSYMRYHTAIHIISGVIENGYAESFSKGGQIYEDKARIDWDMPMLNRELAEKIISTSNSVVSESHRVLAKNILREEALKIPNLSRTEPGRELIQRLEEVRIVEIEGFDMQADGGTHVSNTKEVGTIKLSKFENKGSHNKRIEFVLV
ncbi:alanyl-tRNA editing protein [Candidatus Marsarchaeota archaeon]|nr:alanyl-tRNA editing protein [Candidatus Marsarchaeota archaeon]